MPGSDAFAKQTAAIEATFVQRIQAGSVQAAQVDGDLLTTRSANVLQPALQQFAAQVKTLLGLADLEVAAQLSFDQAMVTYGLLAELLATARQLLERIRLQVADSSNGAVIFTGLGLYVPDDLDEYLTAMNRFQAPVQRNDANHFCSTYFNSLDVPLILTTSGGFSFYNSDEGLFAVDLAMPPVLQTPSGDLDLSTGILASSLWIMTLLNTCWRRTGDSASTNGVAIYPCMCLADSPCRYCRISYGKNRRGWSWYRPGGWHLR
ncbi:MAG: hypothetical protein HZT40_08970 [Candidatus Thiothrix singaporensis]|uniref:Uncharacterized protein n=1 Tax=Candidatus Thiothrix singaporensis TaxID=2799669 RepID=A0A7L6ARD4_9GAMM|nr:MAG: hypothetical protein HZT40_08970 [Candidatus Thiothrix singaporensis]